VDKGEAMSDYDIHSCGYYCDRPACIKAQRDELRDKLLTKEWVGLTDEEIAEAGKLFLEGNRMLPFSLARAIEAKLKEKNT
jgi:hypothetical protein